MVSNQMFSSTTMEMMDLDSSVLKQMNGGFIGQKCYLDREIFGSLDASVGDFILVKTSQIQALCSMWPRVCTAVNPDKMWFSKMVSKQMLMTTDENINEKSPGTPPSFNIVDSKIKPLSTSKAAAVHVAVILRDAAMVVKLKHETNPSKLQALCRNCLSGLCVADSFYVNCDDLKIAGTYGIAGIQVNSVTPKNIDACIIRKETKVIIDSIHSKTWFEQLQGRRVGFNSQLGGLNNTIETLIDLVRLPLKYKHQYSSLGIQPSQGILLRGPPGCGKTSLVKHIAYVCGAYLLTVNGPEVYGSLTGETEDNLRKVFQQAKNIGMEGPCILFFDEVDSLCPKSGRQSGIQESRVTSQFLTLLDGISANSNLIVIAATNRVNALDPAVRRPGRLDREILINVPTCQQRKDILSKLLLQLPVGSNVDIDVLADQTVGYVGSDLKCLCQEAAYLALTQHTKQQSYQINDDQQQSPIKVRQCHFLSAVKKVLPSLQKGAVGLVDIRPVSWNQIGGLDKVKAQIKQAVEWPIQHPEAFDRMGLRCPKGVLLYGPPGCCKTTLVRAAAMSCHATFLSLNGAQLYSPFVGDSEQLICEVFQRARASAPAIIFLDEIDALVGKRSESSHHGVQDRILSVLLNEMDGIGVKLDDKTDILMREKQFEGHTIPNQMTFGTSAVTSKTLTVDYHQSVLVVGATNRPDMLDEALIRPGRIDRIVYVPHPDTEARLEILKVFTQKMALSGVNLADTASQTDWYTGADLENLCREAALMALTEDLEAAVVTSDHFNKALKSVKASLSEKLVEKYSNVNSSTFKKKLK